MKKTTRLRDILKYLDGTKFHDELYISYRTYCCIDGEIRDIFAGGCRYNFATGELIAEDGDSYSLNDKIIDYSIEVFDPEDENSDSYLCVWYESRWT